jgi:hypothetical protein
VRGIHRLIVDGGQGRGFGDFAGGPVDETDLLSVEFAAPKRLPDRGQAGGEAAAAGEQATHLVGLFPQ